MNKRVWILKTKEAKLNALSALKAVMGEDCMEMILQPHVDDQTDGQRAFFHVLAGIIAKEEGVSPEAMKMDIKRECWGSEIAIVRGHEFEVIKSTTKAKKDEYSELIETAYRIGAFLGHVLPNPRWNG